MQPDDPVPFGSRPPEDRARLAWYHLTTALVGMGVLPAFVDEGDAEAQQETHVG